MKNSFINIYIELPRELYLYLHKYSPWPSTGYYSFPDNHYSLTGQRKSITDSGRHTHMLIYLNRTCCCMAHLMHFKKDVYLTILLGCNPTDSMKPESPIFPLTYPEVPWGSLLQLLEFPEVSSIVYALTKPPPSVVANVWILRKNYSLWEFHSAYCLDVAGKSLLLNRQQTEILPPESNGKTS